MIADLIPKIAEFDQEETVYYPRPSLAGPDRCIRQMVYWGLDVPRNPLPGRTILVFDDSSWHEELTLDWLRKSAFTVHSEQMHVECRPPISPDSGHIDTLITDLLLRDWLLEHKAINHFTFERFWNGEIPQDYIAQTCVYYDGLIAITKLHGALLLLKNKNTSQYVEYQLYYDGVDCNIDRIVHSTGEEKRLNITIPNIVTNACTKFDLVTECIATDTLPDRQYDINDWHCQYCGWGEVCWENYEHEFYQLRTDVMLPEEVAVMVKYFKELGGQKRDITKEHEKLSASIKGIMKSNNTREGYAGEYLCRLKLQKNNTERLYISNMKGGKHEILGESNEGEGAE